MSSSTLSFASRVLALPDDTKHADDGLTQDDILCGHRCDEGGIEEDLKARLTVGIACHSARGERYAQEAVHELGSSTGRRPNRVGLRRRWQVRLRLPLPRVARRLGSSREARKKLDSRQGINR